MLLPGKVHFSVYFRLQLYSVAQLHTHFLGNHLQLPRQLGSGVTEGWRSESWVSERINMQAEGRIIFYAVTSDDVLHTDMSTQLVDWVNVDMKNKPTCVS